MTIINSTFLSYLTIMLQNSLTSNTAAFYYDSLLLLAEYCLGFDEKMGHIDFLSQQSFSDRMIKEARKAYRSYGIIGIFSSGSKNRIDNQFVTKDIERKLVALKKAIPNLPATKAAIIMNGFGCQLESAEVLSIFASYGFAQGMKNLVSHFDFTDINRRVGHLVWLTKQPADSDQIQRVQKRYIATRGYLTAGKGERQKLIQSSGLSRSLFFYYWKSFQKIGLLGLIDKGKEVFRESKMGLANEAKIVIDKLQNPKRPESFYVEQLKTKGVKIERSSVAKVFSRWQISEYRSEFISDLKRLQKPSKQSEEKIEVAKKAPRYVDLNFVELLKSMRKSGIHVDAPGIFILWAYLEQLGIYPVLNSMGLASNNNGKGYSWIDHFLLNISRVFYGISSYSGACEHEEPTLCLFSHLVALPCNDSFLNGVGSITEDQVFKLQKWLVNRLKELGTVQAKRLAFDFKQIDLEVEMAQLRDFGKGPSPRKKICCNGFRPHIAWDLDTGNLVIAEFRKGSARGPTTIKRFVEDFILAPFKGLFNEVYVDSEYTGKNVWNFILDEKAGMGAHITACIKQNRFVKKQRDKFLYENSSTDNFWLYYDDKHVYSSKTFKLSWDYKYKKSKQEKTFSLYCVVKKNILNGSLRCFGTSRKNQSPQQILKEYSHRWIIESGIKDLVQSYYLNKCPGTSPHHVNVHFFLISICKQLYRLIQRDLGDFIKNHDGSVKSLRTMRETLFRQGSARVTLRKATIEIQFLNSYSPKLTEQLTNFYHKIYERTSDGLALLDGLKFKFILNPAVSEEHRNAMKKVPLSTVKNLPQSGKID